MSEVCGALVGRRGYRLAGRGARQAVADCGRLARPLVRLGSLEYFGLRGEGSTPVPLPPPTSPL